MTNNITDNKEDIDIDALLEELDEESSRIRDFKGPMAKIITVLTVIMSLFHLYTSYAGTLLAMKQRSLHLAFVFGLIFLLYPATKKSNREKASILDWIFSIISVIVWAYIFLNVEHIALSGGIVNDTELILGSLAILLTLEIARRAVGPELPIVTIVFLLFAYFGQSMPGLLAHRGFDVRRIVSHMYLTTSGIMGTPIGVSATFVFMFILFGSFLEKTGVGEFFIDFAYALTGTARSGPAMTSVLASGLMGSVSGSSVANTVTTGTFTIPLMKTVGYEPYYAGAVEATASTGGQIMPPVMGAAAFIMTSFTGFSYLSIVKAALIPAVLYYFAVATMVHFEACKLGLEGAKKEDLPSLIYIFRTKGYLVLPLIIIIAMLVMQFTPTQSALVGIISAIVVAGIASAILRDGSFNFKIILEAMEAGAKSAIGVAAACACAGIVVGVVTLTGFGLKIAEIITAIAGGNLLITLFLTMIASIILGMGLPTTAKYIVLATMAVPAITSLGVNLMSAHLFILYFGVIADVTPPVALAAYAGAGIAGANSMRTATQAFKLAIGAFIIPYIFVLEPNLILVQEIVGTEIVWLPVIKAIPTILTAVLGTILLASAMEGYLFDRSNNFERIITLIGSLALLYPGYLTDIIGLVILIGIGFIQYRRKNLITD